MKFLGNQKKAFQKCTCVMTISVSTTKRSSESSNCMYHTGNYNSCLWTLCYVIVFFFIITIIIIIIVVTTIEYLPKRRRWKMDGYILMAASSIWLVPLVGTTSATATLLAPCVATAWTSCPIIIFIVTLPV